MIRFEFHSISQRQDNIYPAKSDLMQNCRSICQEQSDLMQNCRSICQEHVNHVSTQLEKLATKNSPLCVLSVSSFSTSTKLSLHLLQVTTLPFWSATHSVPSSTSRSTTRAPPPSNLSTSGKRALFLRRSHFTSRSLSSSGVWWVRGVARSERGYL
jgi:hypothetical protein